MTRHYGLLVKVGSVLRALRRSQGASQQEVADSAGIKKEELEGIEGGHIADTTLATLDAVSSILGQTLEEVLGQAAILHRSRFDSHMDAGIGRHPRTITAEYLSRLDDLNSIRLVSLLLLENRPLGELLQKMFVRIRTRLERIRTGHWKRTLHGPKHALAVLEIASEILGPLIVRLTPAEKYVLASAGLLHEIGLQSEAMATNEGLSTTTVKRRVATYEAIFGEAEKLGLHIPLQFAVAQVAASHGDVDNQHVQRFFESPGCGQIRTEFLGAVLRLADELHVTRDRLPDAYGCPDAWANLDGYFDKHAFFATISLEPHNHRIALMAEGVADANAEKGLKIAARRIHSVLTAQLALFRDFGLPFDSVELELDSRQAIVERKVMLALLQQGALALEGLHEVTEEPFESLLAYFILFDQGEHCQQNNDGQYELRRDRATFERLMEDFILSSADPFEGFVLLRSEYTAEMLSPVCVSELVAAVDGLSEDVQLAQWLVGTFPGCLRYVWVRRNEDSDAALDGDDGSLYLLVAAAFKDTDSVFEWDLQSELRDKIRSSSHFGEGAFEKNFLQPWVKMF